MDFWRDLFLLTLLAIPLFFDYQNKELTMISFPMAIYFLNFEKKSHLEDEIYLALLFITFPITALLKLDPVLPTLAASFFTVVYGHKKNLKRGLIPSLFLSIFWFLSFKIDEVEVFLILAPLVLLITYRESQMAENKKPLEYSYLLAGVALSYLMIGTPVWLKTLFLIISLPVVLLADTTFIKRTIWIAILLPLAYSGEGFRYFQIIILLVSPILLTILNLVKEELKGFKVSSSNEVVMTYRQIGVLFTLILTLGGFKGTLLVQVFPESSSFALILSLLFALFLTPLKEVLANENKIIKTKNEEIYFLIRTLVYFVLIIFSGGILAKGYNFYSLALLIIIFGLCAAFRGLPIIEVTLKKYFSKLRFSFGHTEQGTIRARSIVPRQAKEATQSFQGWYGYNSSIEISLVFLALFLLVYLEGL